MSADFARALEAARSTGRPLIADGGLGTALESRGIVLDHALWSAGLLREDPSTLAEVHAAFATAGADIVTTASYQIGARSSPGDDGLTDAEVRELSAASVALARDAAAGRSADTAPVFIAGSVGPFGAALGDGSEYTGDYALTDSEFTAFHRPRIESLAEAGADVLALETQPNLQEIRVLADLAEEIGVPAWLTVTLAETTRTGGPGTPPHLPDGTPLTTLAEVAAAHPAIRALGVNCVPPALVTPALEALRTVTELPLVAYPNSGETYDAESMEWQETTAEPGERLGAWPIDDWTRLGARIIGGCCRTGPDDIAALALRASSRD